MRIVDVAARSYFILHRTIDIARREHSRLILFASLLHDESSCDADEARVDSPQSDSCQKTIDDVPEGVKALCD